MFYCMILDFLRWFKRSFVFFCILLEIFLIICEFIFLVLGIVIVGVVLLGVVVLLVVGVLLVVVGEGVVVVIVVRGFCWIWVWVK